MADLGRASLAVSFGLLARRLVPTGFGTLAAAVNRRTRHAPARA